MDLKEFYFENITEKEYHHRFYDLIKNVNNTYNVFCGYEETYDYKFEIFDVEEAILKFKQMCQPESQFVNNEEKCWFYLVTYYLFKKGYQIKEFPKVIERPPVDPYDFTYNEIRSRLFAQGEHDNGKVRYATRRRFVESLNFEPKDNHIEIGNSISEKFIEISNRQASFNNMSIDEKLAEIANLIENMLKHNGKFVEIDYTKICFDYISNDMILRYRKQMQCFRHATDDAILERKEYTEKQKLFLVDYGLIIVKSIHELLK